MYAEQKLAMRFAFETVYRMQISANCGGEDYLAVLTFQFRFVFLKLSFVTQSQNCPVLVNSENQ